MVTKEIVLIVKSTAVSIRNLQRQRNFLFCGRYVHCRVGPIVSSQPQENIKKVLFTVYVALQGSVPVQFSFSDNHSNRTGVTLQRCEVRSKCFRTRAKSFRDNNMIKSFPTILLPIREGYKNHTEF